MDKMGGNGNGGRGCGLFECNAQLSVRMCSYFFLVSLFFSHSATVQTFHIHGTNATLFAHFTRFARSFYSLSFFFNRMLNLIFKWIELSVVSFCETSHTLNTKTKCISHDTSDERRTSLLLFFFVVNRTEGVKQLLYSVIKYSFFFFVPLSNVWRKKNQLNV